MHITSTKIKRPLELIEKVEQIGSEKNTKIYIPSPDINVMTEVETLLDGSLRQGNMARTKTLFDF